MGRSLGSPNQEYRWEFFLYHPATGEILHSKKYVSIKQMHEAMKTAFSLAQLSSYAAKSRSCPKIVKIKKIIEPVKE